jgi:hypothetical protein
MAEINDRLNGLFGYVAGQRPGERPKMVVEGDLPGAISTTEFCLSG